MQAKLPDINAAIVRYRNHALYCFTGEDYTGATIALNNINALLPEEYKIEIDSQKYQEAISEKNYVICPNCDKETQTNKMETRQVLLSSFERMITGKEYTMMWECKNCNELNNPHESKYKKTILQQPCYVGVVPAAPTRVIGLEDRVTFPFKFRAWFATTLEELESKIGKYRADYMAQQGADEIQVPDEDYT